MTDDSIDIDEQRWTSHIQWNAIDSEGAEYVILLILHEEPITEKLG